MEKQKYEIILKQTSWGWKWTIYDSKNKNLANGDHEFRFFALRAAKKKLKCIVDPAKDRNRKVYHV